MLDMGFEQFNAQEDLLYTLAYSIARGLSKAGNAQLLCDFSAGTSHTGNEILSLSLALAKRIKQIAEKEEESNANELEQLIERRKNDYK